MWVNQQPSAVEPESRPLPVPEVLPSPQPPEQAPIRPEAPAAPADKPRPARRRKDAATRDCLWLAGAYLLGTGFAGVLQALCDAGEAQVLAHYLGCWQALFAARDSGAAVGLFLAEYLTVTGALTALLLLGLSALGPLPVFLFAMLYGTGTGLMSTELFSGFPLPRGVVYLLLGGIPAAVAAGCLCLFGASALQVCSRLHRVAFGGQGPSSMPGGARGLVGQYLLLAVVFVPLCGAASGLLCLANRMGL